MKIDKLLLKSYKTICGAVLVAKILNWIFYFGNQINLIINTTMFCLIGIAFIASSFVWQKKLVKIILFLCGAYLIVMNFFAKDILLNWPALISILTPSIIYRFSKEGETTKKPVEAG
ncbi:MAG: hypothetical protein J0H55_06125 [Chitinophagaceae bacterium]|nr:hypothetical protein [Chitinophagaceae bacterium]